MNLQELMQALNKIKKSLKDKNVPVYFVEEDTLSQQHVNFNNIQSVGVMYTSIPENEFPWGMNSEALIEENKHKFVSSDKYDAKVHEGFRPFIYIRGEE